MNDFNTIKAGRPVRDATQSAEKPIEDIYPLTLMQRAILVRCVSFPDQPVYMGQWWALVDGPINTELLTDAWNLVIERHTALRSGFHWELKDEPFQVVHRRADVTIQQLDWGAVSDWKADLDRLLEEDRATPFDLKRPPLIRLRLVRLSDHRHILVWTRHHLVVDGWSLGTVAGEVFSAYRSLLNHEPVGIDAAAPYRRYVEWERQRAAEPAIAYWRRRLADFDPGEAPHSSSQSEPKIAECTATLEAEMVERLGQCARDLRVTMNTLVQGAWALVLSRHLGTANVLFGAVETLRPPHLTGPNAPALVGVQVEVVPVVVSIDATPFASWLVDLQSALVAARDVGGVGIDAIRDILGLPRGVLPFESLSGLQNYPLDERGPIADAGLSVVESADVSLPDMPLNLMVETGVDFSLRLIVDENRYSLDEARQLLSMLATTLRQVPDALSTPVDQIDVMPEDLTERLLNDFGYGGDLDIPAHIPEPTIPDRILALGRTQPRAIAVRMGGQAVSYEDFIGAAWRMRQQLDRLGVGRNDRVGILLDRSPLAIAAILGVMLAGSAYVPLDVDSHAERRNAIIKAAHIDAVITSETHAAQCAARHLVTVDDGLFAPAPEAPASAARPEDEAYVIFTSGSTGRPKGVAIGHDNLRYHVAARKVANAAYPIARFLMPLSLIFDGSVTVIFCTLADGGTLVLPDAAEAKDPARLAKLAHAAQATHTAMIPSLWGLILAEADPEQLASIRLSWVGGEAVTRELVRRHYGKLPDVPFDNEYGLTETTVWATVERCRPDEQDRFVSIGRPIPGCRTYVIDRLGRPCPPGRVGELVVAGPNIGRGYVEDPVGEARAFTANRFDHGPEFARVYHTGDLASHGFDGRIRLHGRADHQVKVNGHRVELGEIEACLSNLPEIDETTVLVRRSGGKGDRLVAHIAGSRLPAARQIRDHARRFLPPYMVPQVIVPHGRLPRTAAGKVDQQALVEPVNDAVASPPRGAMESQLAAIWQDALQRETIGRDDNFFESGGNSLLAMQVVARIRRDLKLEAELLDLFEAPEIALFAQRIADAPRSSRTSADPIVRRQRTRRTLGPAPNSDSGPRNA